MPPARGSTSVGRERHAVVSRKGTKGRVLAQRAIRMRPREPGVSIEKGIFPEFAFHRGDTGQRCAGGSPRPERAAGGVREGAISLVYPSKNHKENVTTGGGRDTRAPRDAPLVTPRPELDGERREQGERSSFLGDEKKLKKA